MHDPCGLAVDEFYRLWRFVERSSWWETVFFGGVQMLLKKETYYGLERLMWIICICHYSKSTLLPEIYTKPPTESVSTTTEEGVKGRRYGFPSCLRSCLLLLIPACPAIKLNMRIEVSRSKICSVGSSNPHRHLHFTFIKSKEKKKQEGASESHPVHVKVNSSDFTIEHRAPSIDHLAWVSRIWRKSTYTLALLECSHTK